MARRNKRASMREGPLADLFRSTEDAPEDPPEPPSRPKKGSRRAEPDPVAAEPQQAPEPPPASEPAGDPDTRPGPARPAKDRLRDVFSSDPEDREPAYGRSDASRTPATAPPR